MKKNELSWTKGEYLVWVGNTPVGYREKDDDACRIARDKAIAIKGTCSVTHKGQTIYVNHGV